MAKQTTACALLTQHLFAIDESQQAPLMKHKFWIHHSYLQNKRAICDICDGGQRFTSYNREAVFRNFQLLGAILPLICHITRKTSFNSSLTHKRLQTNKTTSCAEHVEKQKLKEKKKKKIENHWNSCAHTCNSDCKVSQDLVGMPWLATVQPRVIIWHIDYLQ